MCRDGNNCTRTDCYFNHPSNRVVPQTNLSKKQCRDGANCKRGSNCWYDHPVTKVVTPIVPIITKCDDEQIGCEDPVYMMYRCSIDGIKKRVYIRYDPIPERSTITCSGNVNTSCKNNGNMRCEKCAETFISYEALVKNLLYEAYGFEGTDLSFRIITTREKLGYLVVEDASTSIEEYCLQEPEGLTNDDDKRIEEEILNMEYQLMNNLLEEEELF
jgi:hypothetical protein